MKKLLILTSTTLFFTVCVFAQQPRTAPRPVPTAPKGPPPYVLKKDYEPKMEELSNKVNSAQSAAVAARRSVEEKFSKVVDLDSQMQQVQAILSSANFQIAMNADSLKETRTSIESIQKSSNENFARLEQSTTDIANRVWMLFGIAMAFTILILLVVMNTMKKRLNSLETILHQNEEVLKKSLSLGLEKHQKEIKDEMQSAESRILLDTATLKREFTHQLNQQKESSHSMIQLLATKIEALENPPSEETSEQKDSETIF
ncbi:hypothetical protein AEM51_05340 [Bacteroidetes bacterium UKL13-3]|jgi:hypothetical protein|nr:hypothetical protein AEM51_05340 [Bacteroidetes bacterium UKL13-3]HCP94820.1 hypothetical protein [Bacteroidota bacterium]